MNIIDPHVHLFNIEAGQYHWLKPENPPLWADKGLINKTFNIDDIKLTKPLELKGFVHIEAGFDNDKPWREIEWLEQSINIPFKAIAAADITLSPNVFIHLIDKLLNYSSVVGIRHMFDDDIYPTVSFQNNISANLNYLSQQRLIFETQINTDDKAVNDFCTMVKSHPQLIFILNHSHFCPFDKHNMDNWIASIHRISSNDNVYIKASGWEMISRDYTFNDIELVLNILLKCFTVNRVMLASNFPLTLFSENYQMLWENYLALTYDLVDLEKLVFYNAKRIYQLNI